MLDLICAGAVGAIFLACWGVGAAIDIYQLGWGLWLRGVRCGDFDRGRRD